MTVAPWESQLLQFNETNHRRVQIMPTASDHLVVEETLRVDKSLLADLHAVLGGIDRGSTLTKVMYATGTDNDQELELHFALFRNKHFDSALEFLKGKLHDGDQDDGASGKKLHVTGVGANLHADKIKEILGLETEFIDEAFCQIAGFHFLLKHCSRDAICHPMPTVDESIFADIERNESFQRYRDAQVALTMGQGGGDKFPCLFAIFGSSAGVVLVKEDGSIEVKHRHLLAGKSFLGLCQLLIGTCDYAEIMQLAAVGKRGNIDTQVRDILADSPSSSYGRMPPTIPFFTFGKAVDFDKSLEDTRREDVAQSLVSAFTVNFVNMVTYIATSEKVRNVFYGGNFFQNEVPRQEVVKMLKLFGTLEVMDTNFLKTGHTAAVGAMLSSKQDVTDFFAAMKLK